MEISYKKIAFWVGAVLLCLLLLDVLFSGKYDYLNGVDLNSKSGVKVTRNTTARWVTAGVSGSWGSGTIRTEHLLEFSYPKIMGVDDTKKVELTYSRRRLKEYDGGLSYGDSHDSLFGYLSGYLDESKKIPSWQHVLIGKRTVKLFSSGFDIAPTSSYVTRNNEKSPVKFLWTITPKNEGGSQAIILDIKELFDFAKDEGVPSDLAIIKNGEKISHNKDGFIEFELSVVTIWGVEKKTYELIKLAVALFVFVLMFPLLHDAVRHKFNFKN